MSLAQAALKSTIPDDIHRADHCAGVLKAVAHPLRLRIVAALCQGEEHVNALADRLGTSQAIVSQQLRILRMHDLVGVRKADGHSWYRLMEPNLKSLVGCMDRCAVR